MAKTIHRTTITVTVLSEHPVEAYGLTSIARGMIDGDLMGRYSFDKTEEITDREEITKACHEMDGDETFFLIEDEDDETGEGWDYETAMMREEAE